MLTFAQKNSLLQIGLLQFTPQHTLPHGMFSCLEHFAPQPPLPLNTFCCQEHFASQHTLLPGTLCSSAPFPPWNTLLLNTFYSLELFVPWNSFDHDVKYVKQNSAFNFMVKKISFVLGMLWGANGVWEQSVPRSKIL